MLDKLNVGHWAERGYGSPYDRGSADAYYGRAFNPHWRELGNGRQINKEQMTPEQIEEYRLGYTEETDRKDWG